MNVPIKRHLRTFWANPVVTRDLRGRMRGSKSYWQQAFYLILLGLLAIVGYGTSLGWNSADHPDGYSAVDVQASLQSFYYFIFMTLAGLITLIAPALTAVSITSERQRQSLDLLVTTPLSAAEMLIGKMISSVAFLLLLLALSLPASALCVILGGATLGDVVRVYIVLAIDGLLMAAIGLAVSCAVRASLPALVWSYLIVGVFLILTAIIGSMSGAFYGMGGGSGTILPTMALSVLNPFLAVVSGAQSLPIFGLSIPIWVGAAILTFLLVRILVTAGAYRLGSYGNSGCASLRRQILFFSSLIVFGFMYSLSAGGSRMGATSEPALNLESYLIFVFILTAVFLPSLFTPAVANEDDPPGVPIHGSYSMRQAFQPVHQGALPYYHLWLLCTILSAVLGAVAAGNSWHKLWMSALCTAFYLSSLGFLFWSLSRWTATMVKGTSAARALSFIFFAVLSWLPIALLGLLYSGISSNQEDASPIAWFWIFRPLLDLDRSDWTNGAGPAILGWTAAFSYALGVAAYLPWRSVVPGGRRRKEAQVVLNV